MQTFNNRRTKKAKKQCAAAIDLGAGICNPRLIRKNIAGGDGMCETPQKAQRLWGKYRTLDTPSPEAMKYVEPHNKRSVCEGDLELSKTALRRCATDANVAHLRCAG